VFSREGIAKATLEQVARQAGVSRGAIYWHYQGKQDLLQALCGARELPLEHALPADIGLEAGWQLLHRALSDTVSAAGSRHLSEIMLQQGACATESAAAHQRLLRGRECLMEQLQRLLSQAVARGELAATLDIAALTAFMQVCITGLLYECLQDSGNPQPMIASVLEALLAVAKNPPAHLLAAAASSDRP